MQKFRTNDLGSWYEPWATAPILIIETIKFECGFRHTGEGTVFDWLMNPKKKYKQHKFNGLITNLLLTVTNGKKKLIEINLIQDKKVKLLGVASPYHVQDFTS